MGKDQQGTEAEMDLGDAMPQSPGPGRQESGSQGKQQAVGGTAMKGRAVALDQESEKDIQIG